MSKGYKSKRGGEDILTFDEVVKKDMLDNGVIKSMASNKVER